MVWKIVILSIAIVIASFVIAGAIVAAQVLSGNSDFGFDNDRKPQEPPVIEGVKVSIVDNSGSNSYDPNPVEVRVNDTITWVNDDSNVHTATANDGTFDSEILRRGDTFSFTFDSEGEYPYFCDVHPNMVGTVVVTQGDQSES